MSPVAYHNSSEESVWRARGYLHNEAELDEGEGVSVSDAIAAVLVVVALLRAEGRLALCSEGEMRLVVTAAGDDVTGALVGVVTRLTPGAKVEPVHREYVRRSSLVRRASRVSVVLPLTIG